MVWKPQPKDKDWLNGYKKRPLYVLSTRDPPQTKGHIQAECEGLEKDISCNWDQKKEGVAILISDKIDWNKCREKRQRRILLVIKRSIQEEDITIINIYALNLGAPQYVRQMLTRMKGEINSNTIIVGVFNTPLRPMDRST